MCAEPPNDPASADHGRVAKAVTATARVPPRLNIAQTIIGAGMVAVSSVLFGSYFMQWYHYYPHGGQPWPMADLADSQPFTPWDFAVQGIPYVGYIELASLLVAPVAYAISGLLALLASRGWRIVLGIASLLAALYSSVLTYFLAHPFNDGGWSVSVDAGAQIAGATSWLMLVFAIALLVHRDRLFKPDLVRR